MSKSSDDYFLLLEEIKNHVHECPIGWIGDKMVMGQRSSEKDLIEWCQKLRELVGLEKETN